ncbi:MAG: hypothetical protein ABFD52_06920 [Acidobacteriota bacterium]
MTDLASFLSTRTGALGDRVAELVRDHVRLWHAAPVEALPPGRRCARADKLAAEGELSRIVAGLSSESMRKAFLEGRLEAAHLEAIGAALRPSFRRLLRLTGLPLDKVYDARFLNSTRRFIQAARDFDPALGLASAYQALRNVWIMNSLQFDLGLPVEHTDAVFAYSMVYPYLDNALDDAGTSEAGKLAAAARLRGWLEGAAAPAQTPVEEKLLSLVRLLERQFPRDRFPDVHRSLLAIYNAQVRSLLQQRPGAASSAEEILAISLEKGGASVLADGYLVAGALRPADQEFCFGFGTFLQLADDLQDTAKDSACGHRTLFSRGIEAGPLDATALRLEAYLAAVLERSRLGAAPSRSALCDAIGSGLTLMFRESAGKQPGYFRRAFVRRARRSFPVRFSYLRKLRRRLGATLPEGCGRLADLDPGLVALMALSSRAFSLD